MFYKSRNFFYVSKETFKTQKKKHLTRVRYYIKSLWAEENHWLSDHFAAATMLCKLCSKTENKYFLELILT